MSKHKELYVLPTKTRMNPQNPKENEFYDKDQVAYIVPRDGSYRTITSFGKLDIEVGDVVSVIHDQSGARLGLVTVVGRKVFSNGNTQGEVPDHAVGHWVVK